MNLKKSGVPPCPYKVTVEVSCPVPGCMWREILIKDRDLPPFRAVFATHWNTEHFGQYDLLKEVDLSEKGREQMRLLKELDRILPGEENDAQE